MANVLYDHWGYFVEWYRDDDGNSGYGNNPRTTRWYGSRQDCERLAKNANPPRGSKWMPIKGWQPDMSPGSAA